LPSALLLPRMLLAVAGERSGATLSTPSCPFLLSASALVVVVRQFKAWCDAKIRGPSVCWSRCKSNATRTSLGTAERTTSLHSVGISRGADSDAAHTPEVALVGTVASDAPLAAEVDARRAALSRHTRADVAAANGRAEECRGRGGVAADGAGLVAALCRCMRQRQRCSTHSAGRRCGARRGCYTTVRRASMSVTTTRRGYTRGMHRDVTHPCCTRRRDHRPTSTASSPAAG
jgi:hypothetical protein